MNKVAPILCAVSLGCSFDGPPGVALIDAARPDSADAPTDVCSTFTPSKLPFDRLPIPTGDLALAGGVHNFNTSSGTLTNSDGDPIDVDTDVVDGLRVLVARSMFVTSGTTLAVTGGLPLYIAVTRTATINGVLDVGSNDTRIGPAVGVVCNAPAQPGTDSADGSGGGGGGFGGAGGDGGASELGAMTPPPGGIGGGVESLPGQVRAGCPGGNGGVGMLTALGGAGGAGGGAVELAACELSLSGTITSGGAGGGGGLISGVFSGGGGGGGSGGYIGIDVAILKVGSTTVIAANGGGGGEGASAMAAGIDGFAGAASGEAALGGSGGAPQGADGGLGSDAISEAGLSPTEHLANGGGGGGGGAGFVLVKAGSTEGTAGIVSPPARAMP